MAVSPNGVSQRSFFSGGHAHPHILLGDRVNFYFNAAAQFIFINRNKVHAHGAFAGCVIDFYRIHRCPPVGDFIFFGIRGPLFLLSFRGQVHPADGTGAGFFGYDPRMHPAGIERARLCRVPFRVQMR